MTQLNQPLTQQPAAEPAAPAVPTVPAAPPAPELNPLQAEVERLRTQLAEAQAELNRLRLLDRVMEALPAYHPRDPRLVARLMDLSRIAIAPDGAITGLDEQVKALRAAAPYLFYDAPDPVGGAVSPGVNPGDFDMNAFLRGER